ncbi:cyclophilin-like fold protein [Streptomyces sp. NPDC101455]|uniref:cyclophilin-like fold protein n=1 Tax=Streptomyces sp. NPDC101455 TaxID=3366142 RepID=UPI0037F3F215
MNRTALAIATAGAVLVLAACATGVDAPSTAADPTSTGGQGATATTTPERMEATMKIQLTLDGATHPATLNDSPAARDFFDQLPLELTLRDFASSEKISDLPNRLSTAQAPEGTTAKAGDLTYYAPWGNLAIFYHDAPHAPGLVSLGRLDSGLADLARNSGPFPVRIEEAG